MTYREKIIDFTGTPIVKQILEFKANNAPGATFSASKIGAADVREITSSFEGSFTASLLPTTYKVELIYGSPTSSFYLNSTGSVISASNHTGSIAKVFFDWCYDDIQPFAVKSMTVTPMANYPFYFSGSLVLQNATSSNTDSNGIVNLNMIPGDYKVEGFGNTVKPTLFYINVPSAGGNLTASKLTMVEPETAVKVKVNDTDNSFVLTVSASDARYLNGNTPSISSSYATTASYALNGGSGNSSATASYLSASGINGVTSISSINIKSGSILAGRPELFLHNSQSDYGRVVFVENGEKSVMSYLSPSFPSSTRAGTLEFWNVVPSSSFTWLFNGSEKFRISGSGNVGIGTQTPVNRLDVVGNISCSVITASLFKGTASLATNATNAVNANNIVPDGSNANSIGLQEYVSNNKWVVDITNDDGILEIIKTQGPIAPSGIASISIDPATENVTIGNNDYSLAYQNKLNVNGNIYCNAITASLHGNADTSTSASYAPSLFYDNAGVATTDAAVKMNSTLDVEQGITLRANGAGQNLVHPYVGDAQLNLRLADATYAAQLITQNESGAATGYFGYIGSGFGITNRNNTVEVGANNSDLTLRAYEVETMRISASMVKITGSLDVSGSIKCNSITASLNGTATTASYFTGSTVKALQVTASGIYVNDRIGVGVSPTLGKIQVYGVNSSDNGIVVSTNNQSPWAMQFVNRTYSTSPDNGFSVYQDNSGAAHFYVGGTALSQNIFNMTPTGRVGFGGNNSSPNSYVDVKGWLNTLPQIEIGNYLGNPAMTTDYFRVVDENGVYVNRIDKYGNLSCSMVTASINAPNSMVIPTRVGAASGTPAKGSMTYDTGSNMLYIFNGTAWKSSSFA